MNSSENQMPAELFIATQTLAENITASEPFVAFHLAQNCLDGDAAAIDLLERLSTAQADIRKRQQQGGVRQSDVDALRQLQREVQANPIIVQYAQAQKNAINLLREVNQEISTLLDVDFASLARRSCC
jgi:cell fate (sporulation/competence/biofilm development) regulator YlbF (YheA/YmcA/DUF963 family)